MRKIYFYNDLWHFDEQYKDDLKFILEDDYNRFVKNPFKKLSIILNKKHLYD